MRLRCSGRDAGFQALVEKETGLNLDSCLGCGTCTGGCPNIPEYDLAPREVIALIRMGKKEEVLRSATIWMCLGCYLCEERCPAGIAIPRLMDHLRGLCLEEGAPVARGNVLLFHRLFLDGVARFGRAPEALIALAYSVKTRNYLRDAALGRRMFFKGKLRPFPEVIRGRRDVRGFFRRSPGGGETR